MFRFMMKQHCNKILINNNHSSICVDVNLFFKDIGGEPHALPIT